MHVARLRRRLTDVVSIERARLDRHVLTFGKRGRDGSAKCNIETAADGCVYGVLFRLRETLLDDLDAIEGSDYARIAVLPVGLESGHLYQACCYRAKARAADAESLRMTSICWLTGFMAICNQT